MGPLRERPGHADEGRNDPGGVEGAFPSEVAQASEIEEHRFVLALQDDAPLERALGLAFRDQRGATRGWNELEERVLGVTLLVGKIDPRRELLEHPAHEDRHHEVRRLQHAARPGHAARLDGGEAKRALIVGRDAAEAPESALELFFLLVRGMRVLAVRIRLPDFDQAVAYADALAIEQPPFDRHPLALGAARGDVARGEPVEPDVEIRPDRLAAARVQAHVNAPSAWHRGRAARCRSGTPAPIPERCSPSRTPRPGERALSDRRSSCTSGRTPAAGLPENTSA